MAHRLLRDVEADGWERSDFPIICESCLGDNPYVRMAPYSFPGGDQVEMQDIRNQRSAKHVVKLKNVCQVCLLDLEYGLPVQVRDTALSINTNDAIPKSDVNKEYFAEEHDRRARAGLDYESSYGKVRANDTILKLQRTTPYYKRNRAHVCSFYIRGTRCQSLGELSQQNIKDRYYGLNDPVAMKLLNKAGEMQTIEPPDDESIKTLYVGGLDARITEQDLRDNFYAHGEIESIRMVLQRACAFVTYTTREAAEKAAGDLSNKLVIKGLRLKLMWGRPQQPKPETDGAELAKQQTAVAHSGMLPRAVISQQQGQPLPPGTSQDQIPPPMPYFNIPPPLNLGLCTHQWIPKNGCSCLVTRWFWIVLESCSGPPIICCTTSLRSVSTTFYPPYGYMALLLHRNTSTTLLPITPLVTSLFGSPASFNIPAAAAACIIRGFLKINMYTITPKVN
ncbi:Zinc finger CCCH domain-containing protein 49 [Bienertia sinuspersici]